MLNKMTENKDKAPEWREKAIHKKEVAATLREYIKWWEQLRGNTM
jgi:hypothetical protein